MDYSLILQKEVIEKHNIKETLTPVNLGDGCLEKVSISELRHNLETCFIELSESYMEVDFFLNFIEDYILELRTSKIPSKKRSIKSLISRITKLKNEHPSLDINNDKDFAISENIHNLEWQLSIEKHILAYLKEQKHFIRNWVTEKRKELTVKPLRNWIEKERSNSETKKLISNIIKSIPKPPYDYIELGTLFAQGFIKIEKGKYYYIDTPFDKLKEISDYLKGVILKRKVNNVRQYIGNTLSEKGQKNFYNSKIMMKNIIEFCNKNEINISPEFQSKYGDLIK